MVCDWPFLIGIPGLSNASFSQFYPELLLSYKHENELFDWWVYLYPVIQDTKF